MFRQGAAGLGLFAVVSIVLILIGITLSAVSFSARPWFINQETVQNRASQQYIDTQESHLQKLVTDYRNLDSEIKFHTSNGEEAVANAQRAQQKSIVNEMCLGIAKIDRSYVPNDVNSIVRGAC